MKGKNHFTGLVISQILWLFLIAVIMYIANIRISFTYCMPAYIILLAIYYLKTYIDFEINLDSIEIIGNVFSNKNHIFYKKDIKALQFTEINLFFIDIKFIKILITDNKEFKFYCNGVFSSDSDYKGVKTFDNLYDYAKSIFPNTIFVEYSFSKKKYRE